ncbi:MAG: P63C domain-containing protein [Candidatus Saccharibacteria bacterium]|nr:P63C domain-containing protein [Rhodoferax sp.]
MRSLAKVGIAALVDEATGYQEVRDRDALQALLDKYLLQEHAAWAKRFPDDFYRQMFRLKNWEFPTPGGARPGVVGRYTLDIVYERLAPGLVDELKERNPKSEAGHRKTKHHQWLTDDVGHPALTNHIHAVMGLMRASKTWEMFKTLLDSAFPKKGTQFRLAIDE